MFVGLTIYLCWLSFAVAELQIVSRKEWKAKDPKMVETMKTPVPYVVIHHSYIPGECATEDKCIEAVQWMQNFHQEGHKWNDIGYNFAVGGDGRAYCGRGWSSVGAHAPRYNNISIGICVIGNFMENVPPENQLNTVKQLIQLGVKQGKIASNYKLIGHKQVRTTDCPGKAFFKEIESWEHYSFTPNTEDIKKRIKNLIKK